MTSSLIARAGAVWVLILGAAFANAALRELVLAPRLGRAPALTLSGVLLSLLVFLIAYVCLPWLGSRRPLDLWIVGSGWLVLTVLFELVLGKAQGKPMQTLAEAYVFKDGNIWPLVLLVVLCAPYAAAKFRGWP